MANAVSSVTSLPCECKDNKAIKEKCDIDPKSNENKAFREDQEKRNEARKKYNKKLKPKKRKRKEKEIYRVRDKTWKDKHCQKLLFDYELSADDVKDKLQTVKDEMESLEKDLKGVLYDKAGDVVVDKIEKVATVSGCAAAGAVVGGIIGFFFGGAGSIPGAALGGELAGAVCGAAATVDTVADTVGGAVDMWENKDAIKRRVGELIGAKERVDEFMGNIDNLGKATEEERKKLKEEIYDKMAKVIKDDPCIKAKRCELIPYQQGSPSKSEATGATPMDKVFKLDKTSGCCPGQRAHHIIPKAKLEGCANYTDKVHNNAPTVCAEGGHSSGTHGKMHTNTDKYTEDMIFGENEYKSPHKCANNASSADCTIEASAQAFMETFKESKCKKKCIKDQLEDYYKKLGCKMKPVNKTGGEIEKDKDTGGEGEL